MNTKKIKMSSLLEDPKNTGSSEAQIGLLTNKINILRVVKLGLNTITTPQNPVMIAIQLI